MRRNRALQMRRVATEQLRREAAAAKAAGVPVSEIARAAGLSRQGVYDLLAEPRAPQ